MLTTPIQAAVKNECSRTSDPPVHLHGMDFGLYSEVLFAKEVSQAESVENTSQITLPGGNFFL